jgi:hypothetical protein
MVFSHTSSCDSPCSGTRIIEISSTPSGINEVTFHVGDIFCYNGEIPEDDASNNTDSEFSFCSVTEEIIQISQSFSELPEMFPTFGEQSETELSETGDGRVIGMTSEEKEEYRRHMTEYRKAWALENELSKQHSEADGDTSLPSREAVGCYCTIC